MEKITKPLTLLCIDDDDDDLNFFQEALSLLALPCQCSTASSGRDALVLLPRLRPDYIFLDINMPGMNGFEVLTGIREIASLQDTPVIMLSTSLSSEDRELLFSKGANYCMTKLSDFKSFCKILKAILTHSRLPSEVIINPTP